MSQPWFVARRGGPAAAPTAPRLRLFCFPSAGSGTSMYAPWAAQLDGVELQLASLPGRERRVREAPQAIGPLIEGLAPAVEALVGPTPFAFFGHSMGSLLAYEVIRALRRRGARLPAIFFASASRAPHLPSRPPDLAALDDHALVDELRRLEGTPSEMLMDPEILELVLPVLRADARICRDFVCAPEPPLPLPVVVLGGVDDHTVDEAELAGWRQHTAGGCRVQRFPGGHFYLRERATEVLGLLRAELARVAA